MKYSILVVLAALSLSASALDLGVGQPYQGEVVATNSQQVVDAEKKFIKKQQERPAQADLTVVDGSTGKVEENPSSLAPTNPLPGSTASQTAPASVAPASRTSTATTDKKKEKKEENGKGSEFAKTCTALISEFKQLEGSTDQQSLARVAQIKKDPNFQTCTDAQKIAEAFNKQNIIAKGAFQTSDGAVTCVQVAGYTLDYQSCKSTAQVYNTVVVAAMALEMQAEVRAQNAHSDIAAKAQQKAQAGDVQGAGLQASKENSSTMKEIHTQRAAAYGAAVAALGAKVGTWVGDAKSACKKTNVEKCEDAIGNIQKDVPEEVFANEQAKSFFIGALAKYTAEALKAGIEASKYKTSEEAVAKIQNQYEEDFQNNVQLDECMVNPTAKKCLGPGARVAGDSYGAGTGSFSVGGAGSNSFDLGTGPEAFGEFGDETNIESEQVAAINSPFKDEVKEANDILDQAGAASAGSGGSAPGGGGGGGGGMGGGGSASLGNDTKTPTDTPEEAEIKAKKASAGYASGGATGFTGVKSSGEDSNPFASLFDQKGSAGGVEEDRSIASNDIDDKSSVLFQKISKKYSEMHSNKRIQANNLELE